MRGIFPAGQNPTGMTAFVLSAVALVLFMIVEVLGSYWSLCGYVLCAGCTLLAFVLGAYAHQERNGRLESARSALVVATLLIVYYSATRVL